MEWNRSKLQKSKTPKAVTESHVPELWNEKFLSSSPTTSCGAHNFPRSHAIHSDNEQSAIFDSPFAAFGVYISQGSFSSMFIDQLQPSGSL